MLPVVVLTVGDPGRFRWEPGEVFDRAEDHGFEPPDLSGRVPLRRLSTRWVLTVAGKRVAEIRNPAGVWWRAFPADPAAPTAWLSTARHAETAVVAVTTEPVTGDPDLVRGEMRRLAAERRLVAALVGLRGAGGAR